MLTIDIPPEKKRKIERNKVSNAKRDAKDRNPHFSLTVEVKKGDDARLESLRSRLDRAKSLLGIDRRSSSTQNADLLEKLLNSFELVTPSAVNAKLGTSSASSTMKRSTLSPFPDAQPLHYHQSSVESLEQRRARKRQIYVDAAVDDPCFVCTGESLKSLVKYFSRNSQCEFCGGEFKFSGMSFSQQGHVCRLELPCVSNDSVVWLSSGLLGQPAKYSANVRRVALFASFFVWRGLCFSLNRAKLQTFQDKTIIVIFSFKCFIHIFCPGFLLF